MTPADHSTEHVSDLSLDLAVQGELSEADTLAARAHFDVCRDCRERYETAAGDEAHFRQHVLPRTLENVTRSLGESSTPVARWRARGLVASVIASAAVAAAVLLLVHRRPAYEDEPSGLLRKGGPELTVFARHGERVFRVTDGIRLEPGDTLRFQAEPSGAPYLMVASIDGANHASIYIPVQGRGEPADPGRSNPSATTPVSPSTARSARNESLRCSRSSRWMPAR